MNQKDWTGNKNSIFKTLGASNHTDKEREENDFYSTSPDAIHKLIESGVILQDPIWEGSAGECHLSNALKEHGYNVYSTDLVEHRVPLDDTMDFLAAIKMYKDSKTILTNPPYKDALPFIQHALDLLQDGQQVWMFLKIQFLEGVSRGELFDTGQLKDVYVARRRIFCAKNALFDEMKAGGGSAVAYAWYCFEKNYSGDTVVKWFNK